MRDWSGSRASTRRLMLLRHWHRNAGLTLLELVVVMALITALAGIAVLVLPDLAHKTNNTRMIANLLELDNMIQAYQGTHNGSYPNGFDSLLSADDSQSLYTSLPTSSSGKIVGGYLTAKALTDSHVQRLNRAGITTIYDMLDPSTSTDARNATFLAGGSARTLAKDGYLAFVTQNTTTGGYSLAGNKMQFETNHEYVVFGVGHKCSLVGGQGMIKDQPVILHREGCEDPAKTYCAVLAIFDLGDPSSTGRGAAATFIGCVAVANSYFRFSEEISNINFVR